MYAYRYREEVLMKWKEIRNLIGITEIEREREQRVEGERIKVQELLLSVFTIL